MVYLWPPLLLKYGWSIGKRKFHWWKQTSQRGVVEQCCRVHREPWSRPHSAAPHALAGFCSWVLIPHWNQFMHEMTFSDVLFQVLIQEFSKTHKASNVYKILYSSYLKFSSVVFHRCIPSPVTYLQTRKVKRHHKLLSIAVRRFAHIFWCAINS